jgi:hypothetical protein
MPKRTNARRRPSDIEGSHSRVTNQILNGRIRDVRADLTSRLRLPDAVRPCKTAAVNLARIFKG